ncbi:MAG: DUF2807 domain-containing protein [Cytophagaceae bacterium]|jgi:hypothetical protein|nr:DUF2807 domain-containing protein [Cytophagaceae bacterium]
MLRKYLYPNLLLVMVIIAGLLVSCDSCIKASGDIATEERFFSPFTGVVVEGNFQVRLTQGTTTSVKVTADDNLLSYIKTYVQGSNLVLTLEGNKCFKKESDIIIEITLPDIRHIQLDSDGNIVTMNRIKGDSISILHRGAGKMDIADSCRSAFIQATGIGPLQVIGEVDRVRIENRGQGIINTQFFLANKAYVFAGNIGGVLVYASQELTGEISSAGNILYFGNPPVVSIVDNGSGSAIPQ